MKSFRGAVLACVMVLSLFAGNAASASAADGIKLGMRPAWGACGASAGAMKQVYDYRRFTLYCGNDKEGYRHIKQQHHADFKTLVAPFGRTWEDLLHFALRWVSDDPEGSANDSASGKSCRSRYLYVMDNHGRVVLKKVFKVIYVTKSGKVITAYPDSKNKHSGVSDV